ncbi:hypothetical protein [Mumia sp. DW29H23]|uniref:hypothetical protein n=1 Tax=Mumia sp. DW29H23 TaxID=3421241 RepID=UPI003D688530
MITKVTLEAVAAELYAVLPGDFVGARTAYAKEARASGDAALARRIKVLKKPTKAAWATNLLVRGDREQVDALLSLGAELRDAQERLAGDELRALSSRRRALVGGLVTTARRLAEEAGDPLGDPGAEEVAQTLNAALTDAAAAAALDTGLLVDTLAATGFEPVDLDGKVAVPEAVGEVQTRPRLRAVPSPPTEPAEPKKPAAKKPAEKSAPKKPAAKKPAKKKPEPKKAPPKDDRSAAEAKAERRRKAAEADLAAARAAVEEAEERTASARAVVADLDQRRTALLDQLAALDREIAAAQRDVKAARQARAAAERAEAKAQRAVDRAAP